MCDGHILNKNEKKINTDLTLRDWEIDKSNQTNHFKLK